VLLGPLFFLLFFETNETKFHCKDKGSTGGLSRSQCTIVRTNLVEDDNEPHMVFKLW